MKKRKLTKNDLQRLAAWERNVINSGEIYRISELDNFPFKSIFQMRSAYDERKLGFSVPYRGDLIKFIAPKRQITVHRIFMWMPIIVSVLCIYLAWSFSNWYISLGVLSSILGLFFSSPYNPFRNYIYLISIIGTITAFLISSSPLTAICVSFVVSILSGVAARELYTTAVIEAVLYSEVVFCYLYNRKLILIEY